ncbi:MAG TPA: hypothetical protein VF178_13520 [Gemmatimonadaceae bacterium]
MVWAATLTALTADEPDEDALLRPVPIAPCADSPTPSMPDDTVGRHGRIVAVRAPRATVVREDCERRMALRGGRRGEPASGGGTA